jgi:hypothetical protein
MTNQPNQQQGTRPYFDDGGSRLEIAIGDGLREAQASLAEVAHDAQQAQASGFGDLAAALEPTQQGWQLVSHAFESGMQALQAMRS